MLSFCLNGMRRAFYPNSWRKETLLQQSLISLGRESKRLGGSWALVALRSTKSRSGFVLCSLTSTHTAKGITHVWSSIYLQHLALESRTPADPFCAICKGRNDIQSKVLDEALSSKMLMSVIKLISVW